MKHLELFCVLLSASALASGQDDVTVKNSPGNRYQYMERNDGSVHQVDTWISFTDELKTPEYNPDLQNVYHLFTRANPTVSEPLMYGDSNLLSESHFDASRRTVVLVHGWGECNTSGINMNIVPAYLNVEDVNILVVDWTAGSHYIDYRKAVLNTVSSGVGVGRFLDWLNRMTGASYSQYHVVGHSLGGHQAGIIGRSVGGGIAYITALDPAGPGWYDNDYKFKKSDGVYTEVIHTNSGIAGYAEPLGQTDFYPNGGLFQPCYMPLVCDHGRAYILFAESIFSGGFNSTKCTDYVSASLDKCHLPYSLHMGGTQPKTGSTGIFWLPTNSNSPFSLS